MKFENLITLKTWVVTKDKYGSDFKNLDNEIIAVELKKAYRENENNLTFCSVKIYLNYNFQSKYFRIPKCREFKITYKTKGNNPVVFCIEENSNTYNFYYHLPPSKEWVTKTINIAGMKQGDKKKTKLNLKEITGFVFSFDTNEKKEIIDTLYIKEFVINGYEVCSITKSQNPIPAHYLLRKIFLNNIRLFFLKRKKLQYKITDPQDNPLYCIYPFYQFRISEHYITVCCDLLYVDDNVDFENNKNLSDIWWSERNDEVREGIRNLSYSKCDLKRCIPLNTNKISFKNLNEIKKKYPDIADYIEGKTAKFRGLPRHLFVGFDSACNLRCRSCVAPYEKKQPKEISEKYIQQIEESGRNMEILLISCGGDPFASPAYRKWLYNFPHEKFPKLKTIEFLSNAILWTRENWNKISENLQNYDIKGIISIDGATKETYEYNRGNAKFATLLGNLDYISTLRRKNELIFLTIYFVVQQNNYKEMLLITDLAKKYLFDNITFLQIRNWGTYNIEEFESINIFDPKHPDYKSFKKIYKKLKEFKDDKININFEFKL